MFDIFAKKVRFTCPRCLRQIKVPEKESNRDYPCPECGYVMPIAYIKGYETAPPLFVQMFGMSSHGKTLFLDVLRLNLMGIDAHWGQYTHRSLTELDIEKEKNLRTDVERGLLPNSTQPRERNQNEVYIMQLKQIPRWGSRTLVVMDHPGEYFESLNVPHEEIPFLIGTPTTVMLISIPDLIKNERGESMDHLLNAYITTMERNGVNFSRQRRKLIIVFAKADIIPNLSPSLKHYLQDDHVWSEIQTGYGSHRLDGQSLLEYLERMHRVSNEVKDWLKDDDQNRRLGGRTLVKLIEDTKIEARYTVISSLGQDVSRDDAAVYINPRRVIDPFLWALEFQSR